MKVVCQYIILLEVWCSEMPNTALYSKDLVPYAIVCLQLGWVQRFCKRNI